MNLLDKMTMWRKTLVVTSSLIIAVCLILLGSIDSFITKDSENCKLPTVLQNDKVLKRILAFDELSQEEQRQFELDNEDRLRKYIDYPDDYERAVDILYRNKQFVALFGHDAFESTKREHEAEEAFDYRCRILREKVVSDAFIYLYSPFTANGLRDNSKGLGIDWEEYEKMSIPAKEDYIRSDFQRKYDEIKEKEDNQRALWERILYITILMLGLSIFCLLSNSRGSKNSHARNLALYTVVCFVLSFLIFGVMVIVHPNLDDTLAFVIFDYLPTVIVLSLVERFLSQKSHLDYHRYYLIPEWFSSNLKITNEFRKRLLMIFLIYPFFLIVPLPIVGMFFFAFYILPVLLILGIIWIILWLREGKNIDTKPQVQNDRARLYCRHCGKLIDADSDFCRYCGKKL